MYDILLVSLQPTLNEASKFEAVTLLGWYKTHSKLFSVAPINLQNRDTAERVKQAMSSIASNELPDKRIVAMLNGKSVSIVAAVISMPEDDTWGRLALSEPTSN